MTDTVTLKPCPFCGGEANADGHIKFSQPLNDTWWPGEVPITEAFYVNCVRCGAVSRSGIVGGYQSRDEAITAWNTRSSSTASSVGADDLYRAQEIFESIGITASGCASAHGDPGGGLEMIAGYAEDGFRLLADRLAALSATPAQEGESDV